MRSPPLMLHAAAVTSGDDDAAAHAEAARAQRDGTDLVRNHLEQHVQQNPGRSSDYVTWIATLHPENADVAIDQRFFIPGNPWWRVYEEAKNHDGPNLPTATAVPVLEAEDDEEQQQQQQGSKKPNSTAAAASAPPFCLICSPVDMFAGIFVTVFAIMGVVLCEAFALFLCYIPAAFLYHTAKTLHPPNVCTGIIYSALMIFYYAFALCDSLVLLSSVLVTESVAVAGYITSLCTGGVLMAKHWHQYIRRICHGIRILVRRCSGNNPPRTFLLSCLMEKDEMPESVTEVNPQNPPLTAQVTAQSHPIMVEEAATPSSRTNSARVQHVVYDQKGGSTSKK